MLVVGSVVVVGSILFKGGEFMKAQEIPVKFCKGRKSGRTYNQSGEAQVISLAAVEEAEEEHNK